MEKLIIIKEIFNLFFDDSSEEDSDEEIKLIENVSTTSKPACKRDKQQICANNVDSDGDPGVLSGHEEPHKTFVEDVVPTLSASSFRQYFRVNPDVFELICKEIYPFLHKKYGKGRNPLKLDKQVLIALSYLGNKEGLRAISVKFDISISTAWRIVTSVCDALLKMNGEKKIIKWPSREEAGNTAKHYYCTYKLKATMAAFSKYKPIDGVIGCIGSCHLAIRAPLHAQKAYVNKKGAHSVLLQAVTNEKMEFLFFYAGECGSLDDATLLAKSGLETKINTGYFKIAENQYLLGESSYPLKPWLITPYQDTATVKGQQIFFNTVHADCIGDIKRSFGLLKGRFRRLQYIDCLRPDATTKFIAASCILHNICLYNEDFPDEDVKIEIEANEKECYEETENKTSSAHLKRDLLMDILHE